LRYLRKKEKSRLFRWLDSHLWLIAVSLNLLLLAAVVVYRLFVLGR